MAAKTVGAIEKTGVKEAGYSKEQFMGSEAYKGKQGLLQALLEGGKAYTKGQVSKLVEGYLKREVN